MSWTGELVFGDSWAIFRGQAADNTPHAHAAIQLVFGDEGGVTVLAVDGTEWRGAGFAIQPLVEHSLIANEVVTLLYLEPQSPIALHVADAIGDSEIAVIDGAIVGFEPQQSTRAWANRLQAIIPKTAASIDARLLNVLERLADEPGAISIGDAALASGLSESRMRTLARAQLGLPLSTWLIWRKLERAVRELREGSTLADAAAAGGFADQAHLARAMRRMFGITPRTAQRIGAAQGSRSVQDKEQ